MSETSNIRFTLRVVTGVLLASLLFLLALGDPGSRDSIIWIGPSLAMLHGLTWIDKIV